MKTWKSWKIGTQLRKLILSETPVGVFGIVLTAMMYFFTFSETSLMAGAENAHKKAEGVQTSSRIEAYSELPELIFPEEATQPDPGSDSVSLNLPPSTH